jgi:hypothetical protein
MSIDKESDPGAWKRELDQRGQYRAPTTRAELEQEIVRLHYALEKAEGERDKLKDSLSRVLPCYEALLRELDLSDSDACAQARARLEGK